MAKLSGTNLAGFETQLKTTYMYYTPKDGAAFMTGASCPRSWIRSASASSTICRRKGEVKGRGRIMTPTKTLGSSKNVKLRFDAPT